MAGVIGFIASFFDHSKKSEEVTDQESEKFAESEKTNTEVDNWEVSDNNQESSPEDRIICKFFLEGKCRFGEKCKNIHEGNADPSPKPCGKQNKKTVEEEIVKKKKPAMRTAEDVKNRILWDPMLPEECFIIGYLDRFLGIKEESFSTFSWENLASVDYDVLAIPQHRIQYFKYKSEKVWDKTQRLDVVFGSTGSHESIVDLMERVDREIVEKREERRDEDDSDYDSEEEEEDAYYIRPAVTLTMTERVNTDNNVHMIAEEDRSTHFIAIKINNEEIVENLMRVQDSIIVREELLQECCMKRGLFHVTIAMIRIQGEEGLEQARHMMQRLEAELRILLEDRSRTVLTVRGLNNFGQRVVYGEVEAGEPGLLASLVTRVKRAVAEAGAGVSLHDKFRFVPHVTLAKVSRPVARMRRSKYIDTSYYEDHISDTFGHQHIDNLHLCVIDSSTRYDGFYSTLADLQF